MLERDVEQYLVREVAKIGGKAYKWSSMGNRAVPDRVCFFPNAWFVAVELKAPGKVPTPLQAKVIKSLRWMGHQILVIDTKEKVDIFIKGAKEAINNAK